MKRGVIFCAFTVFLCFMAILLMRSLLLDLGLPDGTHLEKLAQRVQGREVTVEEAVVAFCRTLVENGPD